MNFVETNELYFLALVNMYFVTIDEIQRQRDSSAFKSWPGRLSTLSGTLTGVVHSMLKLIVGRNMKSGMSVYFRYCVVVPAIDGSYSRLRNTPSTGVSDRSFRCRWESLTLWTISVYLDFASESFSQNAGLSHNCFHPDSFPESDPCHPRTHSDQHSKPTPRPSLDANRFCRHKRYPDLGNISESLHIERSYVPIGFSVEIVNSCYAVLFQAILRVGIGARDSLDDEGAPSDSFWRVTAKHQLIAWTPQKRSLTVE